MYTAWREAVHKVRDRLFSASIFFGRRRRGGASSRPPPLEALLIDPLLDERRANRRRSRGDVSSLVSSGGLEALLISRAITWLGHAARRARSRHGLSGGPRSPSCWRGGGGPAARTACARDRRSRSPEGGARREDATRARNGESAMKSCERWGGTILHLRVAHAYCILPLASGTPQRHSTRGRGSARRGGQKPRPGGQKAV